jgi:hypothetical protein
VLTGRGRKELGTYRHAIAAGARSGHMQKEAARFRTRASSTSRTSTPNSWHTAASSFAIEMFTNRKVFSKTFVSSATRIDPTGTTFSPIC